MEKKNFEEKEKEKGNKKQKIRCEE